MESIELKNRIEKSIKKDNTENKKDNKEVKFYSDQKTFSDYFKKGYYEQSAYSSWDILIDQTQAA